MSSHCFSRLPAELAIQVMTHLETPRDLFALIRTSKHIWRVFQENRTAILVAVIENAILDKNISIAVAACEAAQVSKLWWEKSSATAFAECQDNFFKNFPRGRASEHYSLRDRTLLLSLYKLWWISDYFISSFERVALGIAVDKVPLMLDRRIKKIRSSERSRLQRAFLRWEVYRRIVPTTFQRWDHDSAESWDRTKEILKWFPPWEREEILSAQEFLVDFVKTTVRDLGDYIVQEIADMARDMAAKSEVPQGRLERESIKSLKATLDLGGFDVYEHSLYRRRFQSFVGRGLPFIRWLSNLPPKEKIDAVIHYSSDHHTPSILEVLRTAGIEIAMNDAEASRPDESCEETVECPNQGWIWAKTHDLIADRTHDPMADRKRLLKRYALRRMGYVFWDTARLRNDWRLHHTLPSMLELNPRSEDDNDRDWEEEPGIDERFKDMLIPKGACGRYDTGISARLQPSREWEETVEDGYPVPFSDQEAEKFGIEY